MRSIRRLLPLLLLVAGCAHVDRPELEPPDSPDEAARYFAQKRGITPDLDINARYTAARERMSRMQQVSVAAPAQGAVSAAAEAAATTPSWEFLGPGNVPGRTRALLIDPRDSKVIYAGAISGGVWKTVDGGASWRVLTDFLPNIAVSVLAFDPSNPDVIYAGTGEGYLRELIRGTNVAIRGNGIFVSRDAGASWAQLPSTAGEDFFWVNDLAVSTHDPRRLYAATRNGVFRSLDGGDSWTRVVTTNATGGCLDLAFRGDTANDFLFASCGMLNGQATVYRATNAEADGAEWASVLSEPGMSRTTIAVAPSNPNVVYALAAHNGGALDQGLHAVFRSTSGGAAGSWTAQVRGSETANTFGPWMLTNLTTILRNGCTSVNISGISNLGWHANTLAVDPKDSDRVWAGSIDLFRSDDGGKTWGIASFWAAAMTEPFYVHADQHTILFDPHYDAAGNQTMLVTNDGGVFRTDNARAGVGTQLADYCHPERVGVGFRTIGRGLGTTQFYHGAVSPDGQTYLGGAQDNFTPVGNDADGVDDWRSIIGGDGGYVAVDPVDPGILYGESQNANIYRVAGGSLSAVFPPQSAGSFLFISPFVLDPNQHDRLWVGGGTRVWRKELPTVAARVSAPLDGHITALDVVQGNANRMLVGTEKGTIYRNDQALSANDATVWPSTKPRDGWVSSLTFDPLDSSVAYATYADFGGTHVWKSTDGGASWIGRDGAGEGALPDVPVHSLAVDGLTLYLGTDVGVFVSPDGGLTWAAEAGFVHAITEKVLLAPTPHGRGLYAFTHGRGAWRIAVPAAVPPPPRRRAVRQ